MLDTGRLAGIWHQPVGASVAEVGAGTPAAGGAGHAGAHRAAAARWTRRRPGRPSAGCSPPTRPARCGTGTAAVRPARRRSLPGRRRRAGQRRAAGACATPTGSTWPGCSAARRARSACWSRPPCGCSRCRPAGSGCSRPVWTPLEVHDLVRTVLAARLDPAAIELDLPGPPRPRTPGRRATRPRPRGPATPRCPAGPAARPRAGSLVVLLEGGPADVTERAERLVGAAARRGHRRRTPRRGGGAAIRSGPGDTALRLEVPITDLHAAVYALRDAAGAPVPVRGSAGLGVVHAALPGALSARAGGVDPRRRPRGAARPAGPVRGGVRARRRSGRPSTSGASWPAWPGCGRPRSTSTRTTGSPPAGCPAASDPGRSATRPVGQSSHHWCMSSRCVARPGGQTASLRSTRMAMSSRGASTEKPIAAARSRAATTSAEYPASGAAASRSRSVPNSSRPRRRSVTPSV